MASRSHYIFVTLEEFCSWLSSLAEQNGVKAFVYRGVKENLELWDGRRELLESATRVFLARDTALSAIDISIADLKPGKYGWLQADVPRVVGSNLLAIQLAAKNDWFDKEKGCVLQNDQVLPFFDSIWKKWRKYLRFPVWARDAASGAKIAYKSIGYSDGAAMWLRKGGGLRQEGVSNIEFDIQ